MKTRTQTVLALIVSSLVFLGCNASCGLNVQSESNNLVEVPQLVGRVNDYADFLSPEAEVALDKKLKIFEDSTTNQVVFLGVQTLGYEEPEEFALRVARSWAIGQEERDNGVLFLLAREGSRVRIEVGYGLEGALTDAEASSIVLEVPADLEKPGYFDADITKSIDAILSAISGEYLATTKPADKTPLWVMILIIVVGIIFLLAILGVTGGGGSGVGSYSGGFSGGRGFGGGGGFSGGGGGFGGGGAGR